MKKIGIFSVILFITLSIFGIVDVSLYYIMPKQTTTSDDARVNADSYHDPSWVSDYYKELFESSASRWEPYTYWRRRSFSKKYINIDDNGIRKTSQHTCTNEKLKIFFFGGSTVWGTGVRDDFTLPSLLSKQLAAHDICADVTNFGESGYVNTQELFILIRELEKNNIPNIVIFYDGVNDVYSAYQNKIAGLAQNEINRFKEFNSQILLSQHSHESPLDYIKAFIMSTATYKYLSHRGTTSNPAPGLANYFSSNAIFFNSYINRAKKEKPDLSKSCLDIYKTNVEIIESLSKAFNFKTYFILQPTIFQKNTLTSYESNVKQATIKSCPGLKELYKITYALLLNDEKLNKDTHFFSLKNIFSTTIDPVFIDWCHLSETGNEIIAKEIFKRIF